MTMLQTRHLTLAPCTPDDRDDFIGLELDPQVMQFLNGGPVDHANLDPAEVTFLMPRGTESFVWTARLTASGAFVGWFCLSPEGDGVAELGYRLRREAWGKGFATEGGLALVEWGFTLGGYERIVACTMSVHTASRRVMEKVGMRYWRTEFPVFTDPLPGSEEGDVWYERTRPSATRQPDKAISPR